MNYIIKFELCLHINIQSYKRGLLQNDFYLKNDSHRQESTYEKGI